MVRTFRQILHKAAREPSAVPLRLLGRLKREWELWVRERQARQRQVHDPVRFLLERMPQLRGDLSRTRALQTADVTGEIASQISRLLLERFWLTQDDLAKIKAFALSNLPDAVSRTVYRADRVCLSQWLLVHPDARLVLRIIMRGHIDHTLPEKLSALGIEEVVDVNGVVPRAEAHRQMRRSYALLVVATNHPMQVPAKTFEYIAMRRRLIVVTEPDSATAELLSREPYCYIADDAGKACAAMEACWRDYTSEAPAFVRREEILNRYSYTRLATQLARLIRRL